MNLQQREYEENLKLRREEARRKGNAVYDPKYDAYYDKTNNEWLESACDSDECPYCKDRPKKHI